MLARQVGHNLCPKGRLWTVGMGHAVERERFRKASFAQIEPGRTCLQHVVVALLPALPCAQRRPKRRRNRLGIRWNSASFKLQRSGAKFLEHLSRRKKGIVAGAPVEALYVCGWQTKRSTTSIRRKSRSIGDTVEWSLADIPDKPIDTRSGKSAMLGWCNASDSVGERRALSGVADSLGAERGTDLLRWRPRQRVTEKVCTEASGRQIVSKVKNVRVGSSAQAGMPVLLGAAIDAVIPGDAEGAGVDANVDFVAARGSGRNHPIDGEALETAVGPPGSRQTGAACRG